VSLFGDRITILAVPFAAVALDASPLQMSVLTAAGFLPWLLFGTVAGVLVDRSRHRTVMIMTDLGRAAVLLTVPCAAALGVLSYWHLAAVALSAGVLTVLFETASSALLPSLVGLDRLTSANAKLSTSGSAMSVAGPGAAGGLIQMLTAPFALLVDALSFLASAALLTRVPPPAASPAPPRRRFAVELREGISFVRRQPMMRALVAEAATSNLGASMNGAVVVLFAVRELHLTAGQFGLASVGVGLGGTLVSLVTNRIADRVGVGVTIAATCVGIGVAGVLIALAGGGTGLVLTILAAAYLLWGASLTAYSILAGSLRQVLTPERLRGRTMSTMNALVVGVNPIGAILGGLFAGWFGLRGAMLVAGGLLLGSAVWIVLSPVFRVRAMPVSADRPADDRAAPPVRESVARGVAGEG
jgi:MFS family permease